MEELKQRAFPNGRKKKSSSNWWTDGYIQARNYLYGSDSTLQDFEKGISEVPSRKQSRGMGLPCTTLVECLRMAWDGMRMWGRTEMV